MINEATPPSPSLKRRLLRVVVNLLVCLAILAAAVVAVIWINRTEPTAEKLNATRKSAALVETLTVRRGTYSPRLVVLGTVQSAQQISLQPRVSGQVIELATEFVPGGMVRKGDLLLRIDPADFENALSITQSELEQAEASMEIEQARQRLAKKELKLLEGSVDESNRGLVMREPQIASMKAEVSAAKAAVDRAKLDLDRTEVYAPFDAQVLSRSVNIGSQVGPGDELGQLIGREEYWIMAAVPVRSLRWVQFPSAVRSSVAPSESDVAANSDDSQTAELTLESADPPAEDGDPTAEASHDDCDTSGSKVILRNPDAWGPGVEREARVSRLIGTLNQQTRLARVLIIVDDPLGENSDVPPLILDTLLQTEIVGRPIENVVRLEREFVRDQDTVWVMKDEKLEIRIVDIVFSDADYAYIQSGLEDGEEVVITTLSTVAEGVSLRKSGTTADNELSESDESLTEDASQ